MKYSRYYQALVSIPNTWFVTAVLRSFEHVAFDRTLDAQQGLFEFFVPEGQEVYFLEIMNAFQMEGIVSNVCLLENRLLDKSAEV